MSDKAILGFATYGAFRNGAGYRFQREHTVLLEPTQGGKGVGTALMNALIEHAIRHNIQSLWAGISAENENAVPFHAGLGFQHVARLTEVGWKFDRWHDLILMRKEMREG